MSNYFISGISSGIGYALATHLSAEGNAVYGLGRKKQAFQQKDIHYCQIDLGSLDDLDSRLNILFDQCPAFEYAILNAAQLGEINYLHKTPLALLKQNIDVNLWSQKILIDKLLIHSPAIRLIVAISSGAAIDGGLGWNGYSISKAASKMMIDIYAQEHSSTHFLSVAPGLVDTQMHDDLSRQAVTRGLDGFQCVSSVRSQNGLSHPQHFAKTFCTMLPEFLNCRSGSYVDIRNFVREPCTHI
jgi:benzil reductase ((S)-benzoin forming)